MSGCDCSTAFIAPKRSPSLRKRQARMMPGKSPVSSIGASVAKRKCTSRRITRPLVAIAAMSEARRAAASRAASAPAIASRAARTSDSVATFSCTHGDGRSRRGACANHAENVIGDAAVRRGRSAFFQCGCIRPDSHHGIHAQIDAMQGRAICGICPQLHVQLY